MAMIFMDGFDYLIAANMPRKWDNGTAGNMGINTGVYGRGKSVSLNLSFIKTLPANYVTGFLGFHFLYPAGTPAMTIAGVRDAATTQVDLRTDATGALFFTRNGTTIG